MGATPKFDKQVSLLCFPPLLTEEIRADLTSCGLESSRGRTRGHVDLYSGANRAVVSYPFSMKKCPYVHSEQEAIDRTSSDTGEHCTGHGEDCHCPRANWYPSQCKHSYLRE